MAHETYEAVKNRLESEGIREMIAGSLGSPAEVDAWINAVLATIGTDKEILKATPLSILGAVLEAASLGLRFEGPLGEAYLATRSKREKDDHGRWGWSQPEAQLQIGYRGLMKLARRDPRVRKIEAILVHANDAFEHRLGSDPFLHHTWDVRKPRGPMVAVYAAIRYNDGFYDFGQPFSMDAVMRHRENILADKRIRVEHNADGSERFVKVWDDGEKEMTPAQIRRLPWVAYLEAMAMKTAVRWSAKYWDLDPDFDRATALISIDESGRSQKLEEIARRIIPEDAKGQENGEPAASRTVQGAALMRQGSLRDQMLRESGLGQGDNEGPPSEEAPHPEEENDEEHASQGAENEGQENEGQEASPMSGMSEEEKQAALELERQEAEAFEEEQRRLAEEADRPRNGQRRGGRRGSKK